jgi:hypothetical protein
MSQINYYKREGQVCKLTGIIDLKPGMSLQDVRQANELQVYIGQTHWQVVWSDGEVSKVMPLEAEEV